MVIGSTTPELNLKDLFRVCLSKPCFIVYPVAGRAGSTMFSNVSLKGKLWIKEPVRAVYFDL